MRERHYPTDAQTATANASPAIVRIHRELHARVSEPVAAPCRIRHSAYLMPDDRAETRDAVSRSFEEVTRGMDIPRRNIFWGERSGRVETALTDRSTLRVVWELHTEFYSYTTYHLLRPDGGAPDSENTLVPMFTFPAMPSLGTKLVDLDLAVLPGLGLDGQLREFLGEEPYYGGLVNGGDARAWTTFQVSPIGQGRYAIRAGNLPPGRLGRLIRRIVEIENYVHLILLPLPDYRERVEHLREIERRITALSEEIADGMAAPEAGLATERERLLRLTQDLAELTRITEALRHRVSAANSYHAILQERLRWLRERTGEGYQSLEEFLTARVDPAIRNYQNFMERADRLSGQIHSLGTLMRTRISLNMENQSLQTLQSMNRRADLQLLLQRTVEGLSLIVIAYYGTGLVHYVLKAAQHVTSLPGDADVWAAATIPLWLLLAYLLTRGAKRAVKTHVKTHLEDGNDGR